MPPDGEDSARIAGRLIATPIGRRIIPTPGRASDTPIGRVVEGRVVPVDAPVEPSDEPVEPAAPEDVPAERVTVEGIETERIGAERISVGRIPIERLPFERVPGILLPRTIPVVRPADLLVAEFELVNLEVRSEGEGGKPLEQPEVVRTEGDDAAFLILHLPPQNIAEQAFFEADPSYPADESGAEDPPEPPVLTRIAGTSRIAFKVPAGFRAIPYTIEGLLDACRELELNVAATALPPQPPKLVIVADIFGAPRWIREIEGAPAAVEGRGEPSGRAAVVEGASVRTVMHAARGLRWKEGAAVEMRMETPVTHLGLEAVKSPIDVGRVRLRPQIAEPGRTETAIEAPYRLIVSPSAANGWAHRTGAPVAASGRVELWHTRLGTRQDGTVVEGQHYMRKLRAIWARSGLAPDHPGPRTGEPTTQPKPRHSNEPFRMSLDAFDRWDVVHLTSNYALTENPEPVDVDNLMLSSLGAWMDTRGQWDLKLDYPDAWDEASRLAVEEWKHRGTMGRDHYVRVVYKGYLFPFGHRASLVKVTERKWHPDKHGNPAYLRQRMFIVVRKPLKEFLATNLTASDATPLASGDRLYDRQIPFSSVRITTLVTPNLNPPEQKDYDGRKQSLFWPRVGNDFFRFHLVAVDLEGNTVEFTAPLAFTDASVIAEEGLMRLIRDDYEKTPELSRVGLFGQKVSYAESERSGDTSFETDTVTFGAEVPQEETQLGPDHPSYYPCVRRAEVRVPSVKQFTGRDDPTVFNYAGEFLKEAAGGGFGGANKGQVFFEVSDGMTLPLDFTSAADRAGGLLQPNVGVKGLSRMLGPVSGATDLSKIASGSFDPADFFSQIEAKLFGVLNLADIVAAVGLDEALDAVPKFISEQFTAAEAFLDELEKIRKQLEDVKARAGEEAAKVQAKIDQLKADFETLTSRIGDVIKGVENVDLAGALTGLAGRLPETAQVLRALPPDVGSARDQALQTIERFSTTIADAEAYVARLLDVLQLPDELKMKFEWKPKLQSWPDKPIFVAERNGKPATLTVAAEISAKSKLNPDPQVDIVCRLENFSLDLIGNVESFIKLHFDKIEFLSGGGSKSDVNVEFAGIEFVGPLSFVEALRDVIPLDGFSDPPALTVSEKGIESSFSLALPNLAFGVFSLQNLSLGAGFKVPFIGDPLSVRFQFCERESPFLLTVSAFGGGGFFGVELDPNGVKMLEASFEFGASLSVDFGVASGGIYVMGGIYFKMQDGAVELTGYLRMGGNVEVLGIVSVSIELMMSLTYEGATGKCIGRATLSIEIEIAFFSTTVEISCERKFAGSNGDPSFEQLMAPEGDYDPWTEYCEAFARA